MELLGFLKFEGKRPLSGYYFEEWINGVRAWLKSKNREARDTACSYDCKFASSWRRFYWLVEQSPLVLEGKQIVVAEKIGIWGSSFSQYFMSAVKDLMLMAGKGKFPRRPNINIETRARFLSDFKNDLETGNAPKLLLAIWALVKN